MPPSKGSSGLKDSGIFQSRECPHYGGSNCAFQECDGGVISERNTCPTFQTGPGTGCSTTEMLMLLLT
jgi:hypothetical protein